MHNFGNGDPSQNDNMGMNQDNPIMNGEDITSQTNATNPDGSNGAPNMVMQDQARLRQAYLMFQQNKNSSSDDVPGPLLQLDAMSMMLLKAQNVTSGENDIFGNTSSMPPLYIEGEPIYPDSNA